MVVSTAAYTPHFESVARGVPAFADFTFLYLAMLIYIRLLMTAPVPKNSEHFEGIVLMIVASLRKALYACGASRSHHYRFAICANSNSLHHRK
jgi:hypothetical protein